MLPAVVPDRLRALIADERAVLARLQRALDRAGATDADRSSLDRSIAQLDRLFLLVIVGEFNAGKSAFINALLGMSVLEEGVTPTTTRLQVMEYGDHVERRSVSSGSDLVRAPVPLLRDLSVVDTPGVNAIFREHEQLTGEFVPEADLVLFVTSADRPFTESERAFLQGIRDWGKKIVLVVNKVDLLERADERDQVRAFVADNARALLGVQPELFMVSARSALKRKTDPSAATPPPGDQFDALEAFVVNTLDERTRLELKLGSPLGVGARLIEQSGQRLDQTRELIRHDLVAVDDIERQLDLYRADLSRGFELRLAEIDNVLHVFEQRGAAFFDDRLRLGRITDLLNKERLQRDFERQVVADVPQQIEARVQGLIDWMVERELAQWQSVTDHVERRRRLHEERIVGGELGRFQYDRDALLNTLGRAAREAVDRYDKSHEAQTMAEGVKRAVAGAALAQVGAVGLGATVAALATTTAADVTGIIAAGAIAVLGLFVIPSKRAHAKGQLRDRVLAMRTDLMSGLRTAFQTALASSNDRIASAVGPYTRFVRAEQQKLSELSGELDALGHDVGRLRAAIQRGW